MNRIYYIGVGSNLGNRFDHIHRFIQIVHQNLDFKNFKISSFYQTEPVDYQTPNWFLNAVCQVESNYEVKEMFQYLKKIETLFYRDPSQRYSDRELDLDLIAVDETIFHNEQLMIPHIKMHERLFVLVPFMELNPHWLHPVFKKNIQSLIDKCPKIQIELYHENLV